MMEEAPPDIKRRRIVAADSSPQDIGCLSDLPSGILAHAASFLAAPSKALFAIALDENSAVSPNDNERSAAIVGSNEWATLDFGGIEKELVVKLNDDDIKKVLTCIDAVNRVKRLKLTNCHINGAGLEPLRGSSIIEQIDLSLVGEHQNPIIYPEPPISCDHVLPILDSIIEREGCALRHLQFPSVWREEPSAESDFRAFILRYNQMRGNLGAISCMECNQNLRNEWIAGDVSEAVYGTHFYTCYDCMKHYCYECEINGETKNMLSDCHICKRDYCVDCIEMQVCRSCGQKNCNDCYEHECHNCNEKICSECVEEDKCEDCNAVFCSSCNVMAEARTCGQCNYRCCNYCRFQKFRQGQLGCSECIKGIAHLLVDESKRLYQEVEQLKVENKEQQGEIKELKREIKELELDNKELRSRNFE